MKETIPEVTGLTFDEIKDWRQFERLARQYFEDLKNDPGNNIAHVEARPTGEGTDGGKDIIVEMTMADDIKTFSRTWIVQCKFRSRPVSPSDINEINIPSLVHSHQADGYLLICRSGPTSGITGLFDRLNEKCKHGYLYECWDGELFLSKLLHRHGILKLFFPKYYYFTESKEAKK